MSYLTLQEVTGEIKRTNSDAKGQRTENNRTTKGPSHWTEFYVPHIVKLFAHITLNTRA